MHASGIVKTFPEHLLAVVFFNFLLLPNSVVDWKDTLYLCAYAQKKENLECLLNLSLD